MKTRSWTIQCTSCFFSAFVSTFLLFNSNLKTMMHAACLLIMKCNIYRLKQKRIPESLHWQTSFCESNEDTCLHLLLSQPCLCKYHITSICVNKPLHYHSIHVLSKSNIAVRFSVCFPIISAVRVIEHTPQ